MWFVIGKGVPLYRRHALVMYYLKFLSGFPCQCACPEHGGIAVFKF